MTPGVVSQVQKGYGSCYKSIDQDHDIFFLTSGRPAIPSTRRPMMLAARTVRDDIGRLLLGIFQIKTKEQLKILDGATDSSD